MVKALKVGGGTLVFFSNRVSMQPVLEGSVVLGAAVTLWPWEAGLGRVSP